MLSYTAKTPSRAPDKDVHAVYSQTCHCLESKCSTKDFKNGFLATPSNWQNRFSSAAHPLKQHDKHPENKVDFMLDCGLLLLTLLSWAKRKVHSCTRCLHCELIRFIHKNQRCLCYLYQRTGSEYENVLWFLSSLIFKLSFLPLFFQKQHSLYPGGCGWHSNECTVT